MDKIRGVLQAVQVKVVYSNRAAVDVKVLKRWACYVFLGNT